MAPRLPLVGARRQLLAAYDIASYFTRTGPEQVFLSGLRSKQGVQQSVRRRSSSPMNGVLAAIRPRCDAAGSNSVACFGGVQQQATSGEPPGPSLPAPTGNARGDVFAVSLLQSAIFTQPDSIWPIRSM
ncbi:hypothetical protein CI102_5926 [Trichoderma harzianum]|uniref:Uncharacterized protein n=1 Tax=Trichoderma harzianum CBS 226.95 TaxID=983964 RepID=A0A2T4AVE9_TRIHA|nr:hypothetical protein M431DRAFT_202791 [Trichoderma harzianum CBS 226.95]PKK51102.1 hypothetical protein CI102_5926 [Trichoderma harzianum]PTB61046.1 hypothetical protein M431DRAFT_202791 [Trichoderma harzianum CBS 226.95]